MAVMTYTKRQVVADLFPEFLSRRGQPFMSRAEGYAHELGIPRTALQLLAGSVALWEDGTLTRARSRWRSPYVTNEEPREQGWRQLVQAGLAADVASGWEITARGREVAVEYQRRFRACLRDLDVPREPTARAARETTRLAARIPADAERTMLVRALPGPDPSEPRSDLITLNRAVNELWSLRDDCHIGAWRDAGYEGPALDVLTQVWRGRDDLTWSTQGGARSMEDLAKAIGTKQSAADLESNVDALVSRGDLTRHGGDLRMTPQGQRARDAIEEETDRRYFVIWDLDDAATARLGDDLRAVIDVLPKA